MSPQRRQPFGQRVHDWLNEPEGETFRLGKWRFWFIAAAGLQLLNAGLTALIFKSAGSLHNYMGAILLGVGALVGWIAVGALHYSDAPDRKLARGVSGLDSATLLFVIAHFCFLTWTYGHLATLRNAEVEYRAQAERFNTEARQVSADNVKIATAAQTIAQETTKAERLRNDASYQLRKAAEAGLRVPGRPSAPAPGVGPALSTAPIELERPTKPAKSSAEFLTEWDGLIRLASFGELLLAAVTLIFIRNQTAKTNAPRVIYDEEEFPESLDLSTRTTACRPEFAKTHVSYEQEKTPKTHVSFNPEGLKRLRETLKGISFRLAGVSFKADLKNDAVWVRAMRANAGTQETTHSAKAKLGLHDDAVRMERNAFRERLERFLRQNGFEL